MLNVRLVYIGAWEQSDAAGREDADTHTDGNLHGRI